MSTKKIIAIVGATGTQGSSVVHTFLDLPNWHVRALTRSPTSEKAQTLAAKGAEVIQADLNDLDSLSRAFKDAHAIFLNTDFWEPFRAALASGKDSETACKIGYDTEVTNGKNAISAAANVPTLERFIYSALGPMNRASGGKYPHSHHWETKAFLVDYINDQEKELAAKTSFIYIGAYLLNQFLYPKPRKESGGAYAMVMPASKQMRMPIIDTARSTGPFVRALIEDETPRTKLLAYDEYLTIEQVIEVWEKVTGKKAAFVQMGLQELHAMSGVPLEVLYGPAFVDEFGYCGGIDGVIEPAQLKAKVNVKTFEESIRGLDMDFLLGLQGK
ncbi:hypothetical protein N7474_011086 [Penicillium riverlandense]|uniref:uncharacterized protein n=1 Tax=Penicillium riverlandense TaxID=1903569 RepID=UPI002546CDCB|nr:uncharacterized protein N7474_011086 [Penicillium riverlandense]KAJ5805199.1 hypothetical protein N7474_011086 [Penicillium riverlandense]